MSLTRPSFSIAFCGADFSLRAVLGVSVGIGQFSDMTRSFQLADFDFELPPELIAQHPAAERSASRLLDGTRHAAGRPHLSRAARLC